MAVRELCVRVGCHQGAEMCKQFAEITVEPEPDWGNIRCDRKAPYGVARALARDGHVLDREDQGSDPECPPAAVVPHEIHAAFEGINAISRLVRVIRRGARAWPTAGAAIAICQFRDVVGGGQRRCHRSCENRNLIFAGSAIIAWLGRRLPPFLVPAGVRPAPNCCGGEWV